MMDPPSDPWATSDPVPSHGYQVPGDFGYTGPAYHPGNDPLVPPPGSRLDAWYDRVSGTLRRSWQPLFLLLAVTVMLPQLLATVVGFAVGTATGTASIDPAALFDRPGLAAGVFLLAVLLIFAQIFANALGWAAGIWAVTQHAAGRPAPFGDALRAGLGRALSMVGWYLLTGAIVAVGLILCILPGLYFVVALSLFSSVVMFERGANPLGRSFSLVNGLFGMVLGRVALLAAVYFGIGLLVGCLFGAAAVPAMGARSLVAISGVQFVSEVVTAVLAVPLTAMVLVGLLITYTQVRARTELLSTPQLWSAVSS